MIEGRYGLEVEPGEVNVGDCVLIKQKLPNRFLNEEMGKYAGEYAYVTQVGEDTEGLYLYLDIDDKRNMWSAWHVETIDCEAYEPECAPLDLIFQG